MDVLYVHMYVSLLEQDTLQVERRRRAKKGPAPRESMTVKKEGGEVDRRMKVVQERYGKLSTVVDSLKSKTRSLLLREKKEFLAAYRAHSYKIQVELRQLRRRVVEEKSSAHREEKLKQLKDDYVWYRDVAIAEERASSKAAKELKALKDTMDLAEDQRHWLLKEVNRTKSHVAALKLKIEEERRKRTARQNSPLVSAAAAEEEEEEEEEDCGRAARGGDERAEETTFVTQSHQREASRRERENLRRLLEDQKILCRRSKRAVDKYREDRPSAKCRALRRAFVDAVALVSDRRKNKKSPRDDDKEPLDTSDLAARTPEEETPVLLARLADLGHAKFTTPERLDVLANFANLAAAQQVAFFPHDDVTTTTHPPTTTTADNNNTSF